MPRRGQISKRDVLPDPIYRSKLVTKLVNNTYTAVSKFITAINAFAATANDATEGYALLEADGRTNSELLAELKTKAEAIGAAYATVETYKAEALTYIQDTFFAAIEGKVEGVQKYEEPVEEEVVVSEDEEAVEAPAKDFMDRINPDSLKVVKGFCEPYIANSEVGDTFQFLRMGYFCKDKDSAETPVFNRTVGLKDSFAKEVKKTGGR